MGKKKANNSVEIVKEKDELHLKSEPVDISEMRDLHGKLMLNMMRLGNRALGLSAVQIGIHKRACAVTLGKVTTVMFNPYIKTKSNKITEMREKCLSVAAPYMVKRYYSITVAYMDRTGAEKEMRVEGKEAAIVQHELDHLDGIIISDIGTLIVEEAKK